MATHEPNIEEFKRNLAWYTDRAKDGDEVVIMNGSRGIAVARLVGPDESTEVLDGVLDGLIRALGRKHKSKIVPFWKLVQEWTGVDDGTAQGLCDAAGVGQGTGKGKG